MNDEELTALARAVWPGADIHLDTFAGTATLTARGGVVVMLATVVHREGARGAIEAALLHLARVGKGTRNEEIARQNARIRELDRKVKAQAKHIRGIEAGKRHAAEVYEKHLAAVGKRVQELEAKLASMVRPVPFADDE